jgi:hypothetical protein
MIDWLPIFHVGGWNNDVQDLATATRTNEVLLDVEAPQVVEPYGRHGQDSNGDRNLCEQRAGARIALPAGDADQFVRQTD